jgi:hypothetical protein
MASGQQKQQLTKLLSMDYRAALCECLMQLRAQKYDKGAQMMKDGEDEEERNNLELLSLTYAISHLAEICLLPSLAAPSLRGRANSNISPLDGPAGSLTSDMARYLRLHHTSSLMDLPEVTEMLRSEQPEYYKLPASSSSNDIIPGPYDFYYNLLLRLVIQGQLSTAWTVLSRHSACRHAREDAEGAADGEYEPSPEGEGFAILQAILLSAPIPGGRGDIYCDDAGLDDYLEEESLEDQEGESHSSENENPQDPGDVTWIDGLPPNAYLLWESLPRHADKLRTARYRRNLRRWGRANDDIIDGESSTVPETYQPRVALNTFKIWQDAIRVNAFPGVGSNAARGGGEGNVSALFKRFPQLEQIFSILLGVVHPSIANGSSLSWSEVLLMELLYSRPEIMPDDIATRANVAMAKAGEKNALQETVLNIMNRNAGQVVDTMFSLCGGSSGAALPATMVR